MSEQLEVRDGATATAEWLYGQYLAALRRSGNAELANLMGGLNPRTWSGDDCEPGSRSARHVVDVHGVTFDVVVGEQSVEVDVNDEEVPAGHGPVHINRGMVRLD